MDVMGQLKIWQIAIRKNGETLRYHSLRPLTAEQSAFIKTHREAIVAALDAKPSPAAPPATPGIDWEAPAANSPHLWGALASRLMLEVPEDSRSKMQKLWRDRLGWWTNCPGVHEGDWERMAYVDLEHEVREQWGVYLAVWFTPVEVGKVNVEVMNAASLRPVEPAMDQRTAPAPAPENFGSLFLGV